MVWLAAATFTISSCGGGQGGGNPGEKGREVGGKRGRRDGMRESCEGGRQQKNEKH